MFVATGAALFPGATAGAGAELRVHSVLHVNSRLPAGAVLPIGWVAVGDPARMCPPDRHDEIWEIQRGLDFPGSNLVIADEGFPGTVVRVLSAGVEERERDGRVELKVQAGEPWDPLVAETVRRDLAGLECLSGIPGLTGATPIQNVGAYGQEVAETIRSVRVIDRDAGGH